MSKKNMITAATLMAVLAGSLGMVSVAEARGMGDKAGFAGGRMGPNAPEFAEIDADGDGQLTQEELDAFAAARFAAIDTDGDGVLSADELAAAAEARRAEMEAARVQRMIEARDTNGDGVLSQEEMSAQAQKSPFERLDTNGDGVISAEEFAAMQGPRQPGMRGQGDHDGQGRMGGQGANH